MLWPKKNSYKEKITKKNSCGSKIPLPPPPITFLMVRPLKILTNKELWENNKASSLINEVKRTNRMPENGTGRLSLKLIMDGS